MRVTMQVLNAVAQFERDLLIERTQSGLRRAKFEGKTLGRPSTLSEGQKQDVREDLAKEMSVSAIARKFGTSRQTIMRVRDESSRSVRP
nr:helix-turn-helix domain-containing protein [Sphingomonas psychrolutea]